MSSDERSPLRLCLLLLLVLLVLVGCILAGSEAKKEKEKGKGKKKDIRDYNEADMEKLFMEWEEAEDEHDPDDLLEHERPAPAVDLSQIDPKNPESALKLTKKGKTLMMFVSVSGTPSQEETEKITSQWQSMLFNGNYQLQRYPVSSDRVIFMLKDGSTAWEIKDFLIQQDRCQEVTIEGQVFAGKGSGAGADPKGKVVGLDDEKSPKTKTKKKSTTKQKAAAAAKASEKKPGVDKTNKSESKESKKTKTKKPAAKADPNSKKPSSTKKDRAAKPSGNESNGPGTEAKRKTTGDGKKPEQIPHGIGGSGGEEPGEEVEEDSLPENIFFQEVEDTDEEDPGARLKRIKERRGSHKNAQPLVMPSSDSSATAKVKVEL